MDSNDASHRSFLPIDASDLQRLTQIARQDRAAFFSRNPYWSRLYRRRFLCSALCQGSATHYLDRTTGVKDFDIWHFFSLSPTRALYAKRLAISDFGHPKFGVSPDHAHFVGRRVDLMMRSIPGEDDPIDAIRAYLRAGKTKSARLLAEKAAVGLDPEGVLGLVIWPLAAQDPAA